ncbi:MAG: hypothetical protein JSS75_08780 [Bacteroidetes bacterium]|nr:hypothetical protein [Bacteroidota bacterium]
MADRPIKIAKLIPVLHSDELRTIGEHLTPEEAELVEAVRSNPAVTRSQLLKRFGQTNRQLNLSAHAVWRKVMAHCAGGSEEDVAEFMAERGLFDQVMPQLRRIERQLLDQRASAERMTSFYHRASSIVFNKLPANIVDSNVLVEYARKHDAHTKRGAATTADQEVFLYAIVTQALSPYSDISGTLHDKRNRTIRALASAYRFFRNSNDACCEARFSFTYAYNLILADRQPRLVSSLIERIRTIGETAPCQREPFVRDYPHILEALRHAFKGEHASALDVCRRAYPNDLHLDSQPPAIILAKCASLLALEEDDRFASIADAFDAQIETNGRDLATLFRMRLLMLEHRILNGTPQEVDQAHAQLTVAHARLPRPDFTQEWLYRSILPFALFPGKDEFGAATAETEVVLRWLARRGMRSDHPQTLALQGLQSLITHAHQRDVLARKVQLYRAKLQTLYGTQQAILGRLLGRAHEALVR